jgi:hypothetical protein
MYLNDVYQGTPIAEPTRTGVKSVQETTSDDGTIGLLRANQTLHVVPGPDPDAATMLPVPVACTRNGPRAS